MSNEATLGRDGNYTVFQFGRFKIRFLSPYSLERYVEIKEWDQGYLAVMAKYSHNAKVEEEYIDLVPILEDLYIDAASFLSPIQKVRVLND